MDSFLEDLAPIELEHCNCVVWAYSASHSQLYIRLFPRQSTVYEHLYLGFHSTYYFSGPTNWSGFDFRYGTKTEILKLMEKGFITMPHTSIEPFLDAHRLYMFILPSLTISILAGRDVAVVRKNPHIDFSASGAPPKS